MVIEYKLIEYLNAALDVPAYMEEPETIETSYVLIEKTGSSEENGINFATIAIQSYGPTMQVAVDLNNSVKEVMDVFWHDDDIFRCKLNSDYNYTDTDTHRYRYQAVFDIAY